MGFFNFLDDQPKVTGQERERCLDYLREELRLAQFEEVEADRHNNTMVKYGTPLESDRRAAQECWHSANRLAGAAKAILERRSRMGSIPDAGQETYFAWQDTFSKFSAWASAGASAVEAAADGTTPNVARVQTLLAEFEQSAQKALKSELKFVKRLALTGNEFKNMTDEAARYVDAYPWEPGQKLWATSDAHEKPEAGIIYCTKCGRKNDSQANYCRDCGTPIVVAPRLPAKQRVAKSPLTVTARAVQELKAIQATNSKNREHVLRIDNESGGFSLWLGPEQKGDTLVGSEDTVLLRASPEVSILLEKTSMVVDCVDGRLVVYAEDGAPQL